MSKNQRFETQVKLFFANFWNLAQVLKIWKYNLHNIKKEPGQVFQNTLIPRSGGYHKN